MLLNFKAMFPYKLTYLIIRFVLSPLYGPFTIYGKEHIPQQGGFLVASNHLSNIDPFIAGYACYRRSLSYMAKDSLFKNKIVSFIITTLGAFPVKRDKADTGAVKEAIRRLKEGGAVLIFPEGTRGASLRQKKPNPGIGLIAVKAKVPVIPVYLKGTDKMLPPKAKWFKRHPVIIRIGKPLYFSDDQPYEETAFEIMRSVEALAA